MADQNPDPIKEHYGTSIYHRFDYIVNSDMSIPYALATGYNAAIESESMRRTGLPAYDRAPHNSPIVLHAPKLGGSQGHG